MSDSGSPLYVASCDFCRIGRGLDDSVVVVGESPHWIAFFPLNPATLGHTLVVPKVHVRDYWHLEVHQAAELATAALHVGRAIQDALKPEGMNLITSAGHVAEQSVFHLHLHVVPRWRRDGFGDIWPHDHRYEDAALSKAAGSIRHSLTTEMADRGRDGA